MSKTFHPEKLDIKSFAQAGGHLANHQTLLKYPRLAEEAHGLLHPDLRVDWHADAEMTSDGGQGHQPWLHLRAETPFPMLCQRCLGLVDVPLLVERVGYMTQAARIKQDPAQVRDDARIQAIVDRVREQTLTEGGDADVMEAIYRSLMEACIAYEHREFARLREPATAGSAA